MGPREGRDHNFQKRGTPRGNERFLHDASTCQGFRAWRVYRFSERVSQMVSRDALVLSAEGAAALQLRHDLRQKSSNGGIVVAHDVEPSAAL
jgi:hypothetical protein